LKIIKSKNGILYYAVFLFLVLVLPSCATYYQRSEDLMNAVYTSNFKAANNLLEDDTKWEKPARNKLLFYLNKGTVLWMQGDYANSNIYFSKADFFIEDYNKSVGDAVLTMLVNAKMSTYGGENFEQILLHYYGALNYLGQGQSDEALVEGKRMLEKMQKITDKYQNKNKYKRDAFAHNFIGLIYDSKGEYNDAFIAYKNAYEVYKSDYRENFGTGIPTQLKKDLIRTARLVGFYDEVRKFESEFFLKADDIETKKSNVVFLWNNGMGPIKDQLTISIMIIPYNNGWVQFINPELGIAIPFRVENDGQRKDFLDMKYFKLALPKYVARLPYYQRAQLLVNNYNYELELAEDINAIAFKSLEDRMGRELAMGLSRVALKNLATYKAQQNKDQQGLAAASMLYNVISEQADTRNWQLLPYSINYTRMPLDTGMQTITFEAFNKAGVKGADKTYKLQMKNKETKFISVQTIEFAGYGNK